MSGSWSGVGSNYITMSAGGVGAAGTGAHTIVVLANHNTGSTISSGFASLMAGATRTRDLIVDTGALFGVNDFSSGFGSLSNNTWYVAAISKPAGSAHYRFHLWTYANPASGSMSHGESVGSANQGDGSTTDGIRVGDGDDVGNGLIAVVGVWTTVVSDASLDTLVSNSLAAWSALSPQALITLNNWNGTTGATDVVGTSTQSSVTGTVSTGADPPGFTFDLATPVGRQSTNRHPGAGPGRARFYQTPRSTDVASTDVSAAAEVASATGVAFDAQVAITVNAEATSATGVAFDTTVAIAGQPAAATGTGAAFDAQAAITVNAEATAATGVAFDAVAAAGALAEVASATGTAFDTSVAVAPGAGVASGTGVAFDAQAAITVNAELASGTGDAFDATVSTVAATQAPAELASGTGAASDAFAAAGANAEATSGTGSAFGAVAAIAVNAGAASAAGSAFDATVAVTSGGTAAPAEVATATGTAFDAQAVVTVPARPLQSGWYSYLDIVREAKIEATLFTQRVPQACPHDGEPLREGPGGQWFCPSDGWSWPQDRDDEALW
jgi:hypothetical protein